MFILASESPIGEKCHVLVKFRIAADALQRFSQNTRPEEHWLSSRRMVFLSRFLQRQMHFLNENTKPNVHRLVSFATKLHNYHLLVHRNVCRYTKGERATVESVCSKRTWLFRLGWDAAAITVFTALCRFKFSFYGQIVSPLSVFEIKSAKIWRIYKNKRKTIRLQIHLKSSEPTTTVSQLIPNRCPLIVKGTGRSF